ncbi:MAG: antibiotic biosynthesis monooxygenase [Ktedonobacteraceae bacterium]|nr:antibiotic biosynthesis monooxygenase [Ktedonobacteraceae bacterium]
MYAKATQLQFQAGTTDEATRIIRDIMIPGASKQRGFKGAFMLRHDTDPDKHIVISLWESKDDLLASRPPEDLIPLLAPLDDYIIESEQDTCDVLLAFYNNQER